MFNGEKIKELEKEIACLWSLKKITGIPIGTVARTEYGEPYIACEHCGKRKEQGERITPPQIIAQKPKKKKCSAKKK